MDYRRNIDKKIIIFTEKYADLILFSFFLLLSLLVRLRYMPVLGSENIGTDYEYFLLPWIREYAQLGIVEGLKKGVGNYYVPYNIFLALIPVTKRNPAILISGLSCVFDYLTVFAVYKIVYVIAEERVCNIEKKYIKVFSIFISLFPMMILNSTLWKQCDSIYASLTLLAIYFFLKDRANLSFVFWGLAFTFKLQSIFILPLFVIAYFVSKKISILHILWVPVCFFVAGLPAIICGRSILDTYGTYVFQVMKDSNPDMISENFPCIYNLGLSKALCAEMALAITLMVFATSLIYIYHFSSKVQLDRFEWMYLAGWAVMSCVEFLPYMHERYDYLAIIILTVVALFFRKILIIPVLLMHIVSACTYGAFLFGNEIRLDVLSVVYLIAYAFFTWDFFINVIAKSRCGENC